MSSVPVSDTLEKLRFFIYITKDIQRYERNQTQKDNLINMTNTLKLFIEELFSSIIIKKHLNTVDEKAQKWKSTPLSQEDNLPKKRALNTSCFNQRVIPTIHQYYSSKNEEGIINDDICDTMFDVIKSCLKHGLSIKKENSQPSSQFVLTKDRTKYKCINPQVLLKNKQLKRNLSVDISKLRQANFKVIQKTPSQRRLPEIHSKATQKEMNLKNVFKEISNDTFTLGWKTNAIRRKIFTTDKRIKAIGTHYDYNDFFKYYNILNHN